MIHNLNIWASVRTTTIDSLEFSMTRQGRHAKSVGHLNLVHLRLENYRAFRHSHYELVIGGPRDNWLFRVNIYY